MFQFNHSLFQFADTFDNVKPGAFDLPTTTHNSPGSLKSKSLKFEDSPFNCSFDEGSQSNHAQAIWGASIKYLQSALKEFVDAAKGFNDESLYGLSCDSETLIEENLEELIFKNNNLKIQQKHEFISDLQNETELSELLKELSKIFNESVFHEITYVVFKIWEKKNETHRNKSKNLSEDEPLIPHFDCFWGYEEEQVAKISYAPFFDQKNMEDVILEADKCVEELSEEIYFDKKVRLLNFRQCRKESEEELTVASLFSQFFKTLTRSVFLSSEGFFNQPSNQAATDICEQFNDDFDFQMNDVCALEQLQLNQNRFVRSFSQDFEDDDEEFDFSSAPSKKRKLQ